MSPEPAMAPPTCSVALDISYAWFVIVLLFKPTNKLPHTPAPPYTCIAPAVPASSVLVVPVLYACVALVTTIYGVEVDVPPVPPEPPVPTKAPLA